MNPPTATAACWIGALIETSISRSPSSRFHNSAVIGHGQAGSSTRQRCAVTGPSTASVLKSMWRLAILIRNSSCSSVKSSAIPRLPAATRLMRPLATGIENDADLTSPFSLASASILKSRYLRHCLPTVAGSTGRNFTVLSCSSPITRRARVMIPAASRSSSGVSKK